MVDLCVVGVGMLVGGYIGEDGYRYAFILLSVDVQVFIANS